MLTIHLDAVKSSEYFNPNLGENGEFVKVEPQDAFDLKLEHSLVSISKWESKWHEPFINKNGHSEEQTLDYIKCMTVNQKVPENVYSRLKTEDIQRISEYINNPMTATTITPISKRNSGEVITSELIYYWMIALQIPFECEKWHLNRLLQLVSVCNEKNKPPKKMGKNEIMARNKALNEARRAKYNTKG